MSEIIPRAAGELGSSWSHGNHQDLSIISDEIALERPLAELVASTLKAAGHSPNTERSYLTAIGLFLQFLDQERGEHFPAWRPLASRLEEQHQDSRGRSYTRSVWEFRGQSRVLRLVDAALVDSFRAWREAMGDALNTASGRVYAVRVFLAVALRDRILTTDQGQAIGVKPYRQRQKRDAQPVGRRLAPAEVRALRAAVNANTNKGLRDRALLDVMLYAGLRCEETAMLKLSDFKQDGGRWWLSFQGKGAKTRRVKVHDVLYKSLAAWLRAAGLTLSGNGYVFGGVNKGDSITGRGINTGVVNRIVAEYGAAAGLAPAEGENRLSPHDLRRTFARNAYDNGASLLVVQQQLGHADPKTTAHYIGAFQDDAVTAVDFVRY